MYHVPCRIAQATHCLCTPSACSDAHLHLFLSMVVCPVRRSQASTSVPPAWSCLWSCRMRCRWCVRQRTAPTGGRPGDLGPVQQVHKGSSSIPTAPLHHRIMTVPLSQASDSAAACACCSAAVNTGRARPPRRSMCTSCVPRAQWTTSTGRHSTSASHTSARCTTARCFRSRWRVRLPGRPLLLLLLLLAMARGMRRRAVRPAGMLPALMVQQVLRGPGRVPLVPVRQMQQQLLLHPLLLVLM